jgi:hypothetical protein
MPQQSRAVSGQWSLHFYFWFAVFTFVNYAELFEVLNWWLMMNFTIFCVQFPANSMGTANLTIAVCNEDAGTWKQLSNRMWRVYHCISIEDVALGFWINSSVPLCIIYGLSAFVHLKGTVLASPAFLCLCSVPHTNKVNLYCLFRRSFVTLLYDDWYVVVKVC